MDPHPGNRDPRAHQGRASGNTPPDPRAYQVDSPPGSTKIHQPPGSMAPTPPGSAARPALGGPPRVHGHTRIHQVSGVRGIHQEGQHYTPPGSVGSKPKLPVTRPTWWAPGIHTHP
jgi:hypothetical protein